MTKSTSKQLGNLLNRIPAATAAGQAALRPSAVPYAEQEALPAPTPARPPVPAAEAPAAQPVVAAPAAPAQTDDSELPLQVMIPRRVREELDNLAAKTRKTRRALTLEALQKLGLDVTAEDIAGKRGRKKS